MALQCSDCLKIFTTKRNLNYHIEKKVCVKNNKTCVKCGHKFKTVAMFKYHKEKLVCEKKTDTQKISIKKKFVDKYESYTKQELLLELAHTRTELEILKDHPTNINNNNVQNNIQNNVVVFPIAYGQENINYICKKLGDIVGPLIKDETFRSIPCLFEKIHKNDRLIEYHNVFTTSEKSSYASVHDGKSFSNKPKKTVIDQIIEDKRTILNEYVDSNEDQLGKQVLAKYEKYQDKLDSDQAFRRNLELEIGGLLLDMKLIIANDEKTRKLLRKVDEGNFELDN